MFFYGSCFKLFFSFFLKETQVWVCEGPLFASQAVPNKREMVCIDISSISLADFGDDCLKKKEQMAMGHKLTYLAKLYSV